MSFEYKNKRKTADQIKVNSMLENLPSFCRNMIISSERSVSPRTNKEYLERISVFFRYLHENNGYFKSKDIVDYTPEDISKLNKDDIEEFAHYIYTESATNKTRANKPGTADSYLSALNVLWNYLIDSDRINVPNPVARVRRSRKEAKDPVRLTKYEQDKISDVITHGGNISVRQETFRQRTELRDLCIYKILVGTGIRVSELVGLDVDDINFQTKSFPVIRKRDKYDVIYFNDEIAVLLAEYIEDDRPRYKPTDDEAALFLSSMGRRRGERLDVRSVQNIVKKYAKYSSVAKANLITPHKLRSSYATEMLDATGDLALVQDLLGHEDPKTTKIYAKTNEKKKEQFRNALIDSN